MKKNKKIYLLCLCALFSALIFIATMIHAPIGVNGGYIHLGDGVLYLCAAILPTPYAIAAGVIGGGLSDILGGAPAWVWATVIIKGLSALFFTSKKEKIICAQNVVALFIGAVLCVGGYYLAEVVIYSCGFVIPIASIPFNIVQTVSSAVIFLIIGAVFDKTNIRKKVL